MEHKPALSDDQPTLVSAQLRGETIGFALQNGVSHLAANFYEPYINYRIQKHVLGKQPGAALMHGNYTQNLVGEFAGDLAGSAALIAGEVLFPGQLHAGMRAARRLVDPLYTSVAHRVLADQRDAPDYKQQVEQWKTFQERNLVRSAIIMSVGVAGNLATQKLLMHNPSPTSLIFAGKLASSSITTMLGLATRLMFPAQLKRFDGWIGKRIAPLLDDKRIEGEPPSHAR